MMDYKIYIDRGFADSYSCQVLDNPVFESHVHRHIEFTYILKGTLETTIGDKTYKLSEKNVIIMMPYEIHSYKSSEDCQAFIMSCPPEFLSEYSKFLKSKIFSPPFVTFNNTQFSIVNELIVEDFSDDFKKKALILYTLSDFFKSCKSVNKNIFEYDIYIRAILYISENYKKNISLNDVAVNIGVSVTHLSNILNSDNKTGFSQMVNSLRIHYANTLLQDRSLSINDIALEAGFGSTRNFNRIYKKFFNCTPSEARKEL